jgi:asparagine synthetase B (glutamine-hydrolysing)
MCGVTIVIARSRERAETLAREFWTVLAARGPDSISIVAKECGGLFVIVVASVLWIRGNVIATQPLEQVGTGVLAWNGELFNKEALVEEETSDSLLLLSWLCGGDPVEAIRRCDGPFAITFLDLVGERLLFARNRFGQRSLLIALPSSLPGERLTHEPDHAIGAGVVNLDNDSVVVLTSVVPPQLRDAFAWKEVPVTGVFELSMGKELFLKQAAAYESLPQQRLCDLNQTEARSAILALLQQSVSKRVTSLGAKCRRVRLLFSGGVDCLLLAVCVHRALAPSIELVLRNVAFGADADVAFDRVQSRHAFAELQRLFGQERKWNLEEISVEESSLKDVLERVKHATFPQNTVMDVTIGAVLWFAFGGDVNDDVKVVFSGIGADELFAGYARHKARFNRAGQGDLLADRKNFVF